MTSPPQKKKCYYENTSTAGEHLHSDKGVVTLPPADDAGDQGGAGARRVRALVLACAPFSLNNLGCGEGSIYKDVYSLILYNGKRTEGMKMSGNRGWVPYTVSRPDRGTLCAGLARLARHSTADQRRRPPRPSRAASP